MIRPASFPLYDVYSLLSRFSLLAEAHRTAGLNINTVPVSWLHMLSTMLEREWIARRNREAVQRTKARQPVKVTPSFK